MSWARREFPAQGVVAIFDEPNQTGEVWGFNAPRNAPAKFPEQHLDKVYYHSNLDLLEVAASASVTINHPQVGAASGSSSTTGQDLIFGWGGAEADHLLLDISGLVLTREPWVLVAAGDNILWPGAPVQTASGGRARYVTAYSTLTQVRVFETASRTSNPLPAAAITYSVLVFTDPPAAITNKLKSFDPVTGEYQMGFGRFSSLFRYLQVAPGGSPLGLSTGRNIDLDKGAPRFARPDGTTYDPVPPLRVTITGGTGAYGPAINYGGTFAGSEAVQVQAP